MTQKRFWFVNKRYGYGWVPVTWEGWLVLAVYVLLLTHILRNIYALDQAGRLIGVWFAVSIGRVLLLTAALLLVCLQKGEKPGWHWNGK